MSVVSRDARTTSRSSAERRCCARDAHRLWPIDHGRRAQRRRARPRPRRPLRGPSRRRPSRSSGSSRDYAGLRHCLLPTAGRARSPSRSRPPGVRAGDQVIVPAYSFVATPLSGPALRRDPGLRRRRRGDRAASIPPPPRPRSRRARAPIMPVHMHGCAADMAPILELAERHRLVVIEDAAQAHGATCGGEPVGALGAPAASPSSRARTSRPAKAGSSSPTTRARRRSEPPPQLRSGRSRSPRPRSFDAARPLDGDARARLRRIGLDVPRQRDDGRLRARAAREAPRADGALPAQRRASSRAPWRSSRE